MKVYDIAKGDDGKSLPEGIIVKREDEIFKEQKQKGWCTLFKTRYFNTITYPRCLARYGRI